MKFSYSSIVFGLLIVNGCQNGQRSELESEDQESLAACVNQVKTQLSMSQEFSDDSGTELDDILASVPGDLKNATPETVFERTISENGNAFGIGIEQEFKSGDGYLDKLTLLEVSTSEVERDDSSKILLVTYTQSLTYIDGNGPKFELEKIYRIDYMNACEKKLFQVESSQYEVGADPKSIKQIVKKHFLFDDVSESETYTVPYASYADQAYLAKLSNEDRLKIDRPLSLYSPGFGHMTLKLEKAEPAHLINPNSGLKMEMEQFNLVARQSDNDEKVYSMNLIVSSDRRYQRSVIDLSEQKITEFVDKKIWDDTAVGKPNSADDSVLVEGFNELSFYMSDLSYKVTTSTKLTFDNYQAYFDLKELPKEAENFIYAVKHSPKRYDASLSQPFPKVVDKRYQNYLAETAYYNIADETTTDAIARLKEELNENTASGLVLHAILKEVTSLISYDDDAVGAQAVRPVCSKDAINSGKGVCQHFAAVFITIARGLGIPARQISGLALSHENDKGVAGRHAWVEVLTPGMHWLPLDPQYDGKFILPNSGYFPLLINSGYERKVGQDDGLQEILQKLMLTKGLRFDGQ